MKTFVIINCQHSLLPEQEALLPEEYTTIKVPARGWTKSEMDSILPDFWGRVIFVSPIPYMISSLAFSAGKRDSFQRWLYDSPYAESGAYQVSEVLCFCNDQREKKELPNGKIVSVTAQTGWYLA